MILSDKEIRERCLNYKNYEMDAPMVTPFVEKKLQGASYDCSITEELFVIDKSNQIIDLRNKNDIEYLYNKRIIGDEGFILLPHTYVLVTLNETFYIPKNLTAHLRPRTAFIRIGLMVSGQHINPDSICKLKIGLFNASDNPIVLRKDLVIGQMVFEEMKSVPSDEKLYKTKKDAHYSEDIAFKGARFDGEFDNVVNRELKKILEDK